jgi:hypothetical protein
VVVGVMGVRLTRKSPDRASGHGSDQIGGSHTVTGLWTRRRYSIRNSDSPTVAIRLGWLLGMRPIVK